MYKRILLAIVFVFISGAVLYAQLSTSSPYSRFGIGDLSFKGLGRNMSLGHTGIGNQSVYNINPINPASYSAFNMNTFIFEVGAIHNFTNSKTEENHWYTNNTNLDYLVAGFAVKKWWGTSFGLQPISSIGYQINTSDSLFVDDGYTNISHTYAGEGGLNRFYWGNAFQPIKNLSLGFNLAYNFGSTDRISETSISEIGYSSITGEKHRYLIKGFNYNLGIQFCDSLLSKKDSTLSKLIYTLGFTYENESKLNSFNTQQIIREIAMNGNSIYDTIVNDTISKGKITLPQTMGFGLSLKFNQKLTFSADYTIENWSNILNFDDSYSLFNSSAIGLGLEYCKNEEKNSLRYRIGGYYKNTYLNLNSHQIKQYGGTFGIGIPITSSIINLGLEAGIRGTTDFSLVEETYILFNLNVSVYDMWFVKSKFF